MSLGRAFVPVTRQLKTLGGLYYQSTKNCCVYSRKAYKPKPVDYDKQSVLLPGQDRIRASTLIDDPKTPVWTIPDAPEVTTVYDILKFGQKVSNDGHCLGSKQPGSQEYTWKSYSEVLSQSQNVGSGFIQLGMRPSNDSCIGIFAANREELTISLYACASYSMILVPLYLTLGLPSVMYIINHAKLSLVIANSNENTLLILNNLKDLPTLKTLVTIQDPTEEQLRLAKAGNVQIMTFTEMEKIGKSNQKDFVLPNKDDILCIPFTSGTTGIPKGVMLTHKNFVACVSSLVYGYGAAGTFGGTIISYLPPGHVYEICNQIISAFFARRIAFYDGPVQNLMEEVRRLKPTILPLVPRLMSGIYMKTMEIIKKSKIKLALLQLAMSQKEKLIKKGKITEKSIWDKFIFKGFQEQLGGNVRILSTTSAPVEPDIKRFFLLVSGGYLFECYGSSEVLGTVMSLPEDTSIDNVGAVLSCNHVKLVDVPDMGYFSKDDAGEVCVKGHNVCKGYLENPEATNEAIIDGWFHTGDIGRFLPNGTLKIIDRKKHLFKLSQGEYIAPEKVENAYSSCPEVFQILVDGIPEKDYVVTLVVPEPTMIKKWLISNGFYKNDNLSEVFSNKELRKGFLAMLIKYGKEKHLNSLEQARNMAFLSEPFTLENDLLTPTFKVKRNVARKRFENIYHKLYEEGPLISSLKSSNRWFFLSRPMSNQSFIRISF